MARDHFSGPFGLLAELTYRCPLACAYCSNPVDMASYGDELTTAEWRRVFTEAQELGVLQLHLSGGEPLLRRDVVDLAATARELGMYSNLVTSALGLSRRRAEELRDAGLDHVQVSVQADEPALSDGIAGTPSFDRKIEACRLVKELGWPLTLNVVLHRRNIDRVGAVLRLAEELDADRIELANTQYYGWAWRNRDALLPSRAQLEAAEPVVTDARKRLAGRMEIVYVLPDYYERFPKPCMGGWAARQLTVAPNGDVLPCPAAQILPLPRPSVHEQPLADVWTSSPLFTAFRGTDWMAEPCRDCDRRELDFGGCRCQAFLLTGDASRTDPVCHLSPDHGLVEQVVRAANEEPGPVDLPHPSTPPGGERMNDGSFLALLALGFFLTLDNFRSSIALGTVPFGFRRAVQIAIVFGFWDAVAPLVGGVLGNWFGDEIGPVADYVGPILMGTYGLYLLVGAIRKPEPEELDHPWVTLFGMPLSLSVDNLLAGTGLGILGFSPVVPAVTFGVMTAVMSLLGLCLGRAAVKVIPIRSDLLSGASLVTAAVVLPLLFN